MTLQELLRKGNFDRMFDYIVKFDPKQEGSRFCYQAAYALLCDMEAGAGQEYDVVPNPYAKEKEGVAREITVWCPDLEGCNWQKALGAEREMFKRAGQSAKGHGKPEEHLAMLEANEGNYREALHWFKEAERKGNRTVKTYIWYLERNRRGYV